MAKIIFHPETSKDIKCSYDWYQNQAEGLGRDFLEELESAYDAIKEFPETWPKFTKNCRRFLLSKFPFSVVYRVTRTPSMY